MKERRVDEREGGVLVVIDFRVSGITVLPENLEESVPPSWPYTRSSAGY